MCGEIDHDIIYQHDELGIDTSAYINNFKETYGANVFERDNTKNEYLTEIGIANLIDSAYEIYVNPNNDKLSKTNLIKVAETQKLSTGYHTVELQNPVKLTGDEFAIIVKYINLDENNNTHFGIEMKVTGDKYWSNAKNSDRESFLSGDMTNWYDINSIIGLKGANLTIKAFTTESDVNLSFEKYRETTKDNKNYLLDIEPGTNMSKLKENILTNGSISITDDGAEILQNIKLKTGMKMAISLNNEKYEYILIVAGDMDKDGDSDFMDMAMINKYRLGKINISNEELFAGDLNLDNTVNFMDMAIINKYRLGQIEQIVAN